MATTTTQQPDNKLWDCNKENNGQFRCKLTDYIDDYILHGLSNTNKSKEWLLELNKAGIHNFLQVLLTNKEFKDDIALTKFYLRFQRYLSDHFEVKL